MSLDLEAFQKSLNQEAVLEKNGKELLRFAVLLVLSVGVVVVLFSYIIGIVVISGNSMYPELKNGDIAVYNRLRRSDVHEYIQGEIVIIHDPVTQLNYIKRVIANAGDVVTLAPDGMVLVNGVSLDEPYVGQLKTTRQDLAFPYIVPPNGVFVLGDNRPVSKDSRNSAIGMVLFEQIKGELLFSIRPFM